MKGEKHARMRLLTVLRFDLYTSSNLWMILLHALCLFFPVSCWKCSWECVCAAKRACACVQVLGVDGIGAAVGPQQRTAAHHPAGALDPAGGTCRLVTSDPQCPGSSKGRILTLTAPRSAGRPESSKGRILTLTAPTSDQRGVLDLEQLTWLANSAAVAGRLLLFAFSFAPFPHSPLALGARSLRRAAAGEGGFQEEACALFGVRDATGLRFRIKLCSLGSRPRWVQLAISD